MYKIQEKIQEYIQCLNLPGNSDETIKDALELLKGLNSDEISGNSQLVALLFCTVISNCTEDKINNSATSELIWDSFDNIKDLESQQNENTSTEIIIINFLKKINNMCGMTGGDTEPVSNEMQEQYKMLCSKLEEMKVIFRLRLNGIEIFPSGKLLAKVIGSDYTFEELNEVTLITFLLALEIFDTEPYVHEKSKLNEIIDKCNLKCLRYLSSPSVMRIGGNVWKDNFSQNGVLILRDVNKKIIYIRHPDKKYFKSLDDAKKKKVEPETNSMGRNIAYYYEYDYDSEATFVSIEDIMLTGSHNIRLSVIKEIYNNKMYNAFFEKAFMKIGEEIHIVNLFTAEDKKIIRSERESIEANAENVTDYAMKPFSLVEVWGKELDFIIVGSICKLLTICNVDVNVIVRKLKQTSSSYQNVLIQSWLEYSQNVYENLIKFQELYFSDTLYARKRREIANKKIVDISWIPVKLPEHLLDEALKGLCNITTDKIETVQLERDEDFEGNIIYKNVKDDTEIVPESIALTDKDDWTQEKIYAVKYQEKYFITPEIDSYVRLIRKIKDSNNGLHEIEDFSICSKSQIQVVLEAMRLQEKALKDITDCKVDFNSIAKLRLIHHIICNNILQKDQWAKFIEVINGHQQLKFDFAKGLKLPEDNVLVVPKERQETDSALTSIINEYIRKNAVRNHDFYFSEIGLSEGVYTYRGQKIERIIFLFDTLQSGTSTIRNLRFYFEDYDKTVSGNVQNQHIKYYCNSNEIKLQTIIEKNHPEVEVMILFGSKKGKQAVEEYLSKNSFITNKSVICKREINKTANKDFMDKVKTLYKGSDINIEEGCFPIIREFNQPKRNAFPKDNLCSDNIASIFIKKKEFSN